MLPFLFVAALVAFLPPPDEGARPVDPAPPAGAELGSLLQRLSDHGLTDPRTPDPGTPDQALPDPALPAQGLPDHAMLSEVLRGVVQVPWVDYAALHRDPSGLNRYLEALGATSIEALSAASREEQLAFWINAYNACMLHRVVEHYPLDRANPGLSGRVQNRLARRPANSVWQIRDVFSGAGCLVAGQQRSLDQIEHEIIRPMGEPRIHFAVNCAARSCPPLVPEAYTAAALEQQLEARVRAFIRTPAQFQALADEGVLRMNPILNWFGEDFGGPEGVKAFLQPYLSGDAARLAADPGTRIVFTDYDWTLNDLPR